MIAALQYNTHLNLHYSIVLEALFVSIIKHKQCKPNNITVIYV